MEFVFFSSRRRHTRWPRDWSSDVCSSDLIPLIMFTIIVGINQSNIANLARMGGKVLTYYLFTSAVAIIIGLSIASLFNPGAGLELDTTETVDVPENPEIRSEDHT